MVSQKISFKQAFTSTSAILSAITGEVRRWWINQFPEDFFNTIRITSGIPSVDDIEGDKDRLKQYRKNNPALAIRPRMKFQEDLMGEPLKNPSPFQYENIGPDTHYYTLMYNPQFMQRITFLIEYWKADITIGLRVESEVQMIDIVGMLNTRVFPNNYFYINDVPVCVEIPVSILMRSATDMGYNLKEKEEVKSYIDILQHNSMYPIDIKLKRDNGKKIIAFVMKCNILCKIDQIPEPDINKKGRVQDDTKIQFNMTAQIPYPKLFKITTEAPILDDNGNLRDTANARDTDISDSGFSGNNQMLMNYTIATPMPETIPNTRARLIWKQDFVSKTDEALDYLELGDILPDYVNDYIDVGIKTHQEKLLNTTVMFKLFRDEIEVDTQDYYFDFKTKKLILYKPLRNYIYRLGVYMETSIIKKNIAKLSGITELSKFFDSDFLQ